MPFVMQSSAVNRYLTTRMPALWFCGTGGIGVVFGEVIPSL